MNSQPESEIAVDEDAAVLSGIEQLLRSDPRQADLQAQAFLESRPGHPGALLLQGIARRLTGDYGKAVETFEQLCRMQPEYGAGHMQLGLALREAGRDAEAVESFRRAVTREPTNNDAWRALADLFVAMGRMPEANEAYANYIHYSADDPRLLAPARALSENRLEDAEAMLRPILDRHPNDVIALGMVADIAMRNGRLDVAQDVLRQCLTLAPGYKSARHNYVVVLMKLNRLKEALGSCEELLARDDGDPELLNLKAAILARMGDYEETTKVYQALLARFPNQPAAWMSLGHALRSLGRIDACIDAYRKTIELAPQHGESYWNLANLKTYRFSDADLQVMNSEVAKPALANEDRVHLHFALGKALEDRREFSDSFHHYQEGNRLRRQALRYDPEQASDYIARSRKLFTKAFFSERAGSGAKAADPIFVLGLPRTGSTLVEQILASHSEVEGTMELQDILGIAAELSAGALSSGSARYPELLANLDPDVLNRYGQQYLDRTRVYRKTGAPRFIDKMPNNFAHLGLIHLMLPNASIIDVRRHPMAWGMSIFKHLFSRGQDFSYSLEEIGRYYRDYVDLMAHFDAVLPGRVHRVHYETLVTDTETEIRRLLEYCGLPFESACLEFYKNKRAVSTPSSEQVRSPIFREGLDQWKHYEPWLAPLKSVLGPLAETYPGSPDSSSASH